ncbi:MAG: nuclear transport factor 2 family protein, partial [Bacteroidota bacterium]
METDKSKSEVLDVARQLTQLMIDRNIAELNKILDKDFTLTHITGYVQSKDEWFSEIESEGMKYYSYKEVKT